MRFKKVYTERLYDIVVDKETKMVYLVYNDSSITTLLDKEGKPMNYDRLLEEGMEE